MRMHVGCVFDIECSVHRRTEMAEDAVFTERGRIRVNDTTEIVVSKVTKGRKTIGLMLNRYIESDRYTGYTKGQLIPTECLAGVRGLLTFEDNGKVGK